MALPSWFRQSVLRIRPGTKSSRGSAVPDWDNVTELTIMGCSVQPSSTSLSQDGRVLGISDSYMLYMPFDADVQKGDKIVVGSDAYIVSGEIRPWISPTGGLNNKQATIERWEG